MPHRVSVWSSYGLGGLLLATLMSGVLQFTSTLREAFALPLSSMVQQNPELSKPTG